MPNDIVGINGIRHTASATRETIESMGGEIRFGDVGILFRVLSNVAPDDGAFVVSFNNDQVLLATADHETCGLIVKIKPASVTKLPSRIFAMG